MLEKAARLIPATAVLMPLVLQSPAFHTRTDLVALTVTVIDGNGVPVAGLSEDASRVTEDGRDRPIAHFAAGATPISIVVALDASESMKGLRFRTAREAVNGFLDRLNPGDEFTVIGFNDHPFNISPWSTDRDTITAALAAIEPQGSTALYRAVSTAIDGLRGSKNRRQALVVISDGNDQPPNEPPGKQQTKMAARQRSLPTIDHIRHSEALLYAIGIDAPDTPLPLRLDPYPLRDLTDPTGGSTRIAHSNADVVKAAEQIGDELRQQYVIGFAPGSPGDGKFHKVRVTVSGCPKCTVRAQRLHRGRSVTEGTEKTDFTGAAEQRRTNGAASAAGARNRGPR
jgi:Ca-activated chloride channel family protein